MNRLIPHGTPALGASARGVSALFLVVAFLSAMPAASRAEINLGAEELVTAWSSSIDVPGYSVPSFVHWDGDGLLDLIVGEGSGTYTAKIRVYLNTGTYFQPRFTDFFYAQSEGTDLELTGGG